jgi:tRNA(Arg) A34 adenosine deaminase TadA
MNANIETIMSELIDLARFHNTAFAAALIDDESQLAGRAVNTSSKHGPTAHAEMNLLRQATQNRSKLNGFTLISTFEPCPMCMGAVIWSRISKLYYGASIEEAAQYISQIMLPSEYISAHAFHHVDIKGGIMKDACLSLLQ